jgi:hypothetical protein
MENLTHWKKNNDSRYISGEDLQGELKGLKKEMAVVIARFEDAETFDQNTQKTAVRTGFFLRELNGKELYKPVILNVTNAKFCRTEFKSEFMEHWINKPFVLYACPDKRHGYVARFKKYYPPQISDTNALGVLSVATTKEQLAEFWGTLSAEEKKLPKVIALKDSLKKQFETGEITE